MQTADRLAVSSMAVVEPSESSSLTAWLQRDTALRRFLQTETASAALLLAAAVGALIWANVDTSSYEHVLADPPVRAPR